MTQAHASAAAERGRPEAADALDLLCKHILANRFMPRPPAESVFVGDGNFLPIGVEFLKWFVRTGNLTPHERILDIGCGIGRMAVPLTQYVESGTYDGVDVVPEGIAWCRENISTQYRNFRFHRLDLAHAIYNPAGVKTTTGLRLPFAENSFDFVFMTSVVTHLYAAEIRAYAREIRRVMAPNARLFVTTFMLNQPARDGLCAGRGHLAFDGKAAGPELYADAANPLAAVAHDEDFLLGLFLEQGLRRNGPPIYGRWSGRATPGQSFQDINVLRIDPSLRPAIVSDAR